MALILFRPPLVSFEVVTNRTRRTSDDVLDAHWMKRLRELENAEQFHDTIDTIDTKRADIKSDYDISTEIDKHGDNRTENVWEDRSEIKSMGYNVMKPSEDVICELISCVSSSSSEKDVACLDLRQLNMSAGAFSSTSKLVPLNSKMVILIWKSVP